MQVPEVNCKRTNDNLKYKQLKQHLNSKTNSKIILLFHNLIMVVNVIQYLTNFLLDCVCFSVLCRQNDKITTCIVLYAVAGTSKQRVSFANPWSTN